jgi:hypothetical protein
MFGKTMVQVFDLESPLAGDLSPANGFSLVSFQLLENLLSIF